MKKKMLSLLMMLVLSGAVCARSDLPTPIVNESNLKKASADKINDTAKPKIVVGPRFKISIPGSGKERQFPFVYKSGENIFVSYSEHPDGVIASPTDAMIISRDNGKTWTEKVSHPDFYITSMFEKEGILYGIVYFTYPDSPTEEKMIYWTSADFGKTWIKHRGVVKAPSGRRFLADGLKGIWGSMLFHRGMMVMKDGSVQGAMYGLFEGDKKYTTVWVKSSDNCKTWHIVSVIASGYAEPNVIRVKDNSLLCVMRVNSYKPLRQCRSYDNGLTWTKPAPLQGLPDSVFKSVDPDLLLMSNGVLALSYGRPDVKVAFATDGNGYNWDYHLNVYDKTTSGYSGIVEVAPGRLLIVADQGADWSGGESEKAVWGRFIETDFGK